MGIEIRGVNKRFGTFQALQDIDLSVPDGELLALLGPSGSGKTTLLRIIAGLEFPDSGTIHLNGEDASTSSARDRRIGFVFQHYALFRHMTVFENVAFGLRIRPRTLRPSRDEIRGRVSALLKLVQLDWLADRFPSQLSGGQRQRIALARALYGDPFLGVLDEPNSNLDNEGERALIQAIGRVRARGGIVVIIAHRSTMLCAVDHMLVLNEGRLQAFGKTESVLPLLTPAQPAAAHGEAPGRVGKKQLAAAHV